MYKEKIFAGRRAGLLNWALASKRMEWKIGDYYLSELIGKIKAGEENKILVEIITNTYSVAIPAYGNASGYDQYDITFNRETGQIGSYQLSAHKLNHLYCADVMDVPEGERNKSYNTITESRSGGNLTLPLDSALNKHLSKLFEAISKARAKPATLIDWLAGERKLATNSRA